MIIANPDLKRHRKTRPKMLFEINFIAMPRWSKKSSPFLIDRQGLSRARGERRQAAEIRFDHRAETKRRERESRRVDGRGLMQNFKGAAGKMMRRMP